MKSLGLSQNDAYLTINAEGELRGNQLTRLPGKMAVKMECLCV